MYEQTICALATPPGAGGIAVVRISGPQAYPIAARVFHPADPAKDLLTAKGYTAHFGHFWRQGKPCDQTIALCFRAPKSYTGEDVVELSCHGGSAVSAELLAACYEAGAAPAGAGEFTKRAFLNGRIGLTQAEAVMGVIGAAGRQGAALASAALEGALAKEIGGVEEQLKALLSHIDAWVDFPEEDVPALEDDVLLATLTDCHGRLEKLVDGYGAGAVLQRGVRAAIVGSPNVGKSTLLNLMAGFERAIVTPIAGTTRDVVEQAVMVGDKGIRLELADTAGLRDTGDVVEAEGIRRSYAQMEQAGLVLAVFDASRPATDEDFELAQRCKGRIAIAILNKTDLPRAFDPAGMEGCFAKIVELSATDPAHRQVLTDAIEEVLGIAQLDPNAAALVSERQYTDALEAKDHLRAALDAQNGGFGLDAVGICVEDALQALYRLTGESASEAAIDAVFSTFCVGK